MKNQAHPIVVVKRKKHKGHGVAAVMARGKSPMPTL